MLARRFLFVLSASCVVGLLPFAGAVGAPSPAPVPLPTAVASDGPAPSAPASAGPTPSGPASAEPAPSLAPSMQPEPSMSATPNPRGPAPSTATAPPRLGPRALPTGSLTNPFALGPASYASFVKGMQRQDGEIALLQKDEDLFLDLSAEDMGKTFLIAPELASAVAAEPSAFTGRIFEPLVIKFQRVGKRLLWVEPNTNYAATPNSPAADSLAVSTTDAVVNVTPILAEDTASNRVVVSANFFLTDVENIGRDLGGRGGLTILGFGSSARPGYVVDPTRSYIERAKALPDNDEILASLTFMGQGAESPAIADGRSIRLKMHYSILEAPSLGSYRPRYADDRVGYFDETLKRIGENRTYPPFVHYLDRRDLTKGPITYYLTNEIPVEYRETIRSAILAWNDAFARVGFPDAVRVLDAPTGESFDPDDIRHSTIRWVTGEGSSRVAFGPSVVDPRTGQILRGEVVIDGETISAFRRGYGLTAGPLRRAQLDAARALACRDVRCVDDDADEVSSAALGMLSLETRGVPLPERDAYVLQFLRWVVMHEVGHTLGLSHNFAASTQYTLAQLHDPIFSRTHQLASSVMDYTPVNLSPRGRPQGRYFQDQLGAYDRWAIRYGYEKLPFATPDAELIALKSLASESTRPEYAFESDQDAGGDEAIDPRVNQFDLSRDPLDFAQNQFTIDDQLIASLDAGLPRDGRSYGEERSAFLIQIRDYARSAQIAGKFIGGAYVSRDHRGQPGGAPPIRPVPRAVSQRAFAMLEKYVFSSDALRFSPQLLANLGYDRFGGWGDAGARPDFPAVELIGELQDSVLLDRLLSPDATSRLEEAEFRQKTPGEAMNLGDLFTWLQQGIYDDLGPSVRSTNVIHRNLQRRYTGYLIELVLAPSNLVHLVGYPGDVPVLARQELADTARALDASLARGTLDTVTRAHRADLSARIHRALSASSTAGA